MSKVQFLRLKKLLNILCTFQIHIRELKFNANDIFKKSTPNEYYLYTFNYVYIRHDFAKAFMNNIY